MKTKIAEFKTNYTVIVRTSADKSNIKDIHYFINHDGSLTKGEADPKRAGSGVHVCLLADTSVRREQYITLLKLLRSIQGIKSRYALRLHPGINDFNLELFRNKYITLTAWESTDISIIPKHLHPAEEI